MFQGRFRREVVLPDSAVIPSSCLCCAYNRAPHAFAAPSLAPFNHQMLSLVIRTSKAKAFFFGLSADTQHLATGSLRLRDPMLTCVDDVVNGAHVRLLRS